MRPTLPRRLKRAVNVLSVEWTTKLLDCLEWAMDNPKGDGKTTYRNGEAISALRQSANAPGGAGGDAYTGYFKVIQTAPDKIKIVNGMDIEAANCGYVQCNKLAAQAVTAPELTITQNCYIFRKSVGTFTADVLTSATVTFELLTSFPTYTAGTEYELLSVVTFADSKITDFSNMPLPYRIDITGACDT